VIEDARRVKGLPTRPEEERERIRERMDIGTKVAMRIDTRIPDDTLREWEKIPPTAMDLLRRAQNAPSIREEVKRMLSQEWREECPWGETSKIADLNILELVEKLGQRTYRDGGRRKLGDRETYGSWIRANWEKVTTVIRIEAEEEDNRKKEVDMQLKKEKEEEQKEQEAQREKERIVQEDQAVFHMLQRELKSAPLIYTGKEQSLLDLGKLLAAQRGESQWDLGSKRNYGTECQENWELIEEAMVRNLCNQILEEWQSEEGSTTDEYDVERQGTRMADDPEKERREKAEAEKEQVERRKIIRMLKIELDPNHTGDKEHKCSDHELLEMVGRLNYQKNGGVSWLGSQEDYGDKCQRNWMKIHALVSKAMTKERKIVDSVTGKEGRGKVWQKLLEEIRKKGSERGVEPVEDNETQRIEKVLWRELEEKCKPDGKIAGPPLNVLQLVAILSLANPTGTRNHLGACCQHGLECQENWGELNDEIGKAVARRKETEQLETYKEAESKKEEERVTERFFREVKKNPRSKDVPMKGYWKTVERTVREWVEIRKHYKEFGLHLLKDILPEFGFKTTTSWEEMNEEMVKRVKRIMSRSLVKEEDLEVSENEIPELEYGEIEFSDQSVANLAGQTVKTQREELIADLAEAMEEQEEVTKERLDIKEMRAEITAERQRLANLVFNPLRNLEGPREEEEKEPRTPANETAKEAARTTSNKASRLRIPSKET
jgi:hypothetical protein